MTYEDMCFMLGDREVVIYTLKKEIDELKQQLANLTTPPTPTQKKT
jgi:hypothetical protein